MNQTRPNNTKAPFYEKYDRDISVCFRKCSKYYQFLNTQNKFLEYAKI